MQNNDQHYAGFWIRFAAHMIDFVIVMAALGIIETFLMPVMELLEDTPVGGEIIFQYTLTDVIEYFLTVVYFIVMTYFTGATLGKKVLKLKVVSVRETEKLSLFQVIYRETVGRYLSDAFLGLGYLTVAFNKEKKAIHDMLCDTRVIEVRRKAAASAVKETAEENIKESVDMIPRMVEEPEMVSEAEAEGESQIAEISDKKGYSQEYVEEQWKQILERDS